MPTIKTRRKTGLIALAFHWTLIICTLGLWYPVYASRRRSRVTVTHLPPGYGQPQQYAPPPPYSHQPPPQYGPPPGHRPPQPPYGYQQPPRR